MSQGPATSRPPMWRRVLNRMTYAYNCRFRKQHYVFEFDPSSSAAEGLADVEVERIERADEVDAGVWDALASEGGIVSCENDRAELRDQGTLWVARLEGTVVGAALSRRGRQFRRWFVPLDADDLVIFRVRTLPPYRGRGAAAALLRMIAVQETLWAGKAYVDCRVFNTPSIRMIVKAGFLQIAKARMLTSEETLHVAS